MTLTQNIALDVARETALHIAGKQFDENSRFLLVTIKEAGEEKSIPAGSTITLNARRPDGSAQSFAGSIQDGKALVEIDQWILEQYGTVYCSVSVVDSSASKLTTLSFRLLVERAEGSGFVLVYVAASALAAGTYYITMAGVNYSFTTTQAVPAGGKIYFSSNGTTGKTTNNGATIETLTLTAGSTGTELQGSDVVNFLTQMQANVAAIDGELDSKADKSAIEENLTAGTSLATIDKNSYTPSTSPYLYRQSPSGKRCEYDVIGGTVGWNQLVQNGSFTAKQDWLVYLADYSVSNNEATITQTETSNGSIFQDLSIPAGHTVLIGASIKIGTATRAALLYRGGLIESTTGSSYDTIRAISTAGGNNRVQITVSGSSGTGYAKDVFVIDLTTLLGSTIADYAYTLEQATAGSGIAWLKSFGFLTKSYYEFCEPTLESVQATARTAYGINQWDEEWESGYYDASGNPVASTGQIRSKNLIRVLPNAQYYAKMSAHRFCYYDANGNFISRSDLYNTNQQLFTIPADCYYIKFHTDYTGTYNNDICINISNPTINGTYYPYESHTYPLGNTTLRGIPKLDSNNNIYYDGDRRKADGTITRRYGARAYQSGDESLADAITDGTTTVYKLSTPTTESADLYTPIQYTGSTESFSTDNDVPVGIDGKYYDDLTLPKLPTANGTYTLKCTVTDGTGIVSWVSE